MPFGPDALRLPGLVQQYPKTRSHYATVPSVSAVDNPATKPPVMCDPTEGLVRPEVVVAVEERSQLRARVRQRRVGLQVDLFVLDRAPQPLDEHVGVSRRLRRLATIRADVSG